MTDIELREVINLLEEQGYMKRIKPLWDLDIYRIVKKVNELWLRNKAK